MLFEERQVYVMGCKMGQVTRCHGNRYNALVWRIRTNTVRPYRVDFHPPRPYRHCGLDRPCRISCRQRGSDTVGQARNDELERFCQT